MLLVVLLYQSTLLLLMFCPPLLFMAVDNEIEKIEKDTHASQSMSHQPIIRYVHAAKHI